jgi:hypothetical protein
MLAMNAELIKTKIEEQEQAIRNITQYLFQKSPEFKAWIENTSLFHAIVQDSPHQGILRIHEPDGSVSILNLNGKRVYQAEDLPVEIIQHFYERSPFFKQQTPKLKLLTDDRSSV